MSAGASQTWAYTTSLLLGNEEEENAAIAAKLVQRYANLVAMVEKMEGAE